MPCRCHTRSSAAQLALGLCGLARAGVPSLQRCTACNSALSLSTLLRSIRSTASISWLLNPVLRHCVSVASCLTVFGALPRKLIIMLLISGISATTCAIIAGTDLSTRSASALSLFLRLFGARGIAPLASSRSFSKPLYGLLLTLALFGLWKASERLEPRRVRQVFFHRWLPVYLLAKPCRDSLFAPVLEHARPIVAFFVHQSLSNTMRWPQYFSAPCRAQF